MTTGQPFRKGPVFLVFKALAAEDTSRNAFVSAQSASEQHSGNVFYACLPFTELAGLGHSPPPAGRLSHVMGKGTLG